MKLPPEYDDSYKVAELRKCIYELKQSSREWYDKLTTYLNELGFVSAYFNPCVFIYKIEELIIFVYVNDLSFYESSQFRITNLIKDLEKEFKVTDLKEIT